LGFWIFAGAFKKELLKVKSVVSESESAETLIQAILKTLSRKEKEALALILEHKSN
jgi:hypothetical protein